MLPDSLWGSWWQQLASPKRALSSREIHAIKTVARLKQRCSNSSLELIWVATVSNENYSLSNG